MYFQVTASFGFTGLLTEKEMIVSRQVMAELKFQAESARSQAWGLIIKHDLWQADLHTCHEDRPLM